MIIKRSTIAKYALFAYFFLSPIYVFSSGLPQPSDYVIAFLFFPWVLQSLSKLPRHIKPKLKPYLFFVGWTFCVNLVYANFLDAPNMLRHSLFYTFSLLFCLGIAILSSFYTSIAFFQLIQRLLTIASLTALILFISTWNIGVFRHTGSFNNPNQAAYFGILILCLAIISAWAINQWGVLFIITALSSSLLVVLTYSGGALFSQLVALTSLPILILSSRKVKSRVKYILGAAILIAYLSIPAILLSNSPRVNAVLNNWERRSARLESKAENVVDQRGYNRILHFPGYLLLGAGEGEARRFTGEIGGPSELHSTLGTFLFSYGLVGISLFFSFIFRAMKGAPVGIWVVVSAPLIYSITHQGARQPLFWLVFVLVAIAVTSKRYFPTNLGSTANSDLSQIN